MTFRIYTLIISQAPIFISFFIALRKMAYLPVPSLQTGGTLWFPDLTLADPFYILPLVVTGTMFFILEVGNPTTFKSHFEQKQSYLERFCCSISEGCC